MVRSKHDIRVRIIYPSESHMAKAFRWRVRHDVSTGLALWSGWRIPCI